jgi:hypothetical protein
MRIPSGVTDQYIYFVAVDATDLKTRETGLSSFTVYRSRNGAAAAAMTTPTINETDTTNMPGVYELLLDEDMTIGSGNDSEEMCFHITHAGMAPVTRVIELYRPKITAGNTLGVAADGDISGNLDGTVATVTTLTGHTAQTGDSYARLGAPAGASVSADILAIDNLVDDLESRLTAARAGYLDELAAANIPADIDTLLSRLSAARAGYLDELGPTNLPQDIDAILVDTGTTLETHLTDIKGATFSGATDSLEAIRDRGDAAWTTGSGTGLTALATGTAQAGAAGTITLAAGASATNDLFNEQIVKITSGTGAGQARVISDYVGSTKVASITPNWTTNPDATSVYEIVDGGAAVSLWRLSVPNVLVSGRVDADVGAKTGNVALSAQEKLDVNAEADTAIADAALATAANLTTVDTVVDAIKAVTDLLPDAGALTTIGTDTARLTAARAAVLTDWIDGGRLDLILDAILVDTGTTLPATLAGLNDLSAAQVNTEVDTALTDIHLDHLLAADYNPAAKPGVATALFNELVENDGGVSRYTANALEQAPSGGTDVYNILIGAAYSGTTLTVIAIPLKNNVIQTGLGTMTWKVWNNDGTQNGSNITDASADAQGVYKGSGTFTLSNNTQYYIEASVTIDATTRTVRIPLTKIA